MSVGLLLITHERLGPALLQTATTLLDVCPLETQVVEIGLDTDPEAALATAMSAIDRVDHGDGVLVLTDIYGSTPSNVAARLAARREVRLVAGINLPMLIRVLNYPALRLDELTEKAVSGGRDGVLMGEMRPDDEDH